MSIEIEVELESLSCGVCGMPFAVPHDWLDMRRETHKGFRCPNNCKISYKAPSDGLSNGEVEELVAERGRLTHELHQAQGKIEDLEAQLKALKAEYAPLKPKRGRPRKAVTA